MNERTNSTAAAGAATPILNLARQLADAVASHDKSERIESDARRKESGGIETGFLRAAGNAAAKHYYDQELMVRSAIRWVFATVAHVEAKGKFHVALHVAWSSRASAETLGNQGKWFATWCDMKLGDLRAKCLKTFGWGTWIPSQCKTAYARRRNRIRFQGLVREWTSPLVPGSGNDVKGRFAEVVSTTIGLLARTNCELGKSFPGSSGRVPKTRIHRMPADTVSERH